MNNTNTTGPRDVFLHLLETLALYITVGAFISLLFGFVDIYFPDALRPSSVQSLKSSLRWPIAMLVVVFPFYIWITRHIQTHVANHPAKQKLKTRRWLLHLNVVLAVIIIAGDLITLIYNFLSGGLTAPFVLKVLVVLAIAASALVYYGWILRNEVESWTDSRIRSFSYAVVALGAVAIIFGFITVGSPGDQRKVEFDQRRIHDLQSIQYEIVDYWQDTGDLPENLDELSDDIRGFSPPHDPRTDEPYEYNKTGDLSFELCATFETALKEDGREPPAPYRLEPTPHKGAESWSHDIGRTCFERTINPERYEENNR